MLGFENQNRYPIDTKPKLNGFGYNFDQLHPKFKKTLKIKPESGYMFGLSPGLPPDEAVGK